MTFSDPHRLVALWKSVIIDERIKQLESVFTKEQIAFMRKKAGIR